MKTRALLFATALLIGCKAAETPEQMATRQAAETDSARTAIAAGTAKWAAFATAGQPDSIAALYTTDGVMMPPDAPGATGHDSILARLRPLIIPGATLTITGQNVSVSGTLAVERGVYAYAIPAMGRTPAMNVTGKYLAHWHKMDGHWMLAENTWNTDAPAPPAPPARR